MDYLECESAARTINMLSKQIRSNDKSIESMKPADCSSIPFLFFESVQNNRSIKTYQLNFQIHSERF